jgi:hypothetical protein
MILTVEALNARHGDALLLHYGAPDDPRLAVCDGGPSGVYGAALKPRLSAISQARGHADAMPIEMAIVTHMDDDHIHGILDLFNDLAEKAEDKVTLPWQVRQLWFNQFDDLTGGGGTGLVAAAAAAARPDRSVPAGLLTSADALAVAASVPQARALADHARRLTVAVNGPPIAGLVAAGSGGGPTVDLGSGLGLTVLAPDQARIEALRREWDAVLRRAAAKTGQAALAEVAAYLDHSVFNLSSIVVLAKAGDATALLTGDARGDDILSALAAAGLLAGGKLHVDLLKIPHHGSARNVAPDFFDAVTADHYLISADGKYGNPDNETLRMILTARPHDEFVIHLTNEVPRVTEFLRDHKDLARNHAVEIRPASALSLSIDLGQPLEPAGP